MNQVQHKYNYGGGHTWTAWSTIQITTPSRPELPKITGVEEANGKLVFTFVGVGGGQRFNIGWSKPGVRFTQTAAPYKLRGPMDPLRGNWIADGKFTIPEKPRYETDYAFKVQIVGLDGIATAWVDRIYRTKPDPRPLQTNRTDNVQKPIADGLVQPKTKGNVQKPLADGLVQPKRPITPIEPKTPTPQPLPRAKGMNVVQPPAATAIPARSLQKASR